jgi:hypothetical protein
MDPKRPVMTAPAIAESAADKAFQGASAGVIATAALGAGRSASSAVATAATSAKKQPLRKICGGGSPIDNR